MAFVNSLPLIPPTTTHSFTCPRACPPWRERVKRRTPRRPCSRIVLSGGQETWENHSVKVQNGLNSRISASFDSFSEASNEKLTGGFANARNDEISNHPTAPSSPLKPHQLRVLLLRIRALQTINTATTTLTNLLQKAPTEEQLALHLGLSQSQLRTNRHAGIRARNDLVASYIHLVVKIASLAHARLSRQTPQSIPVEDLVQEGCIALITAAERYDASRGVKFMTYAWNVVYRACLREGPRGSIVSVPERLLQARRRVAARVAKGGQDPVDEETVPEHLLKAAEPHIRGTLPLDAPVGNGERSYGELFKGGVLPEEVVERELVQREVRTACYRSLPERYAEVLIMRFGLNGSPPKRGKAIAGILGVSEPRVAQIVLAGLEKLRKLEPELAEFMYDI